MSDTLTSGDIAAVENELNPPAVVPPAPQPPEPVVPAEPAPLVPDGEGIPPSPKGALPYERHEAILNKQRQDSEERFNKLAWASSHNREEVEAALELAALVDSRPEFVHQELTNRIRKPQPVQPTHYAEDGTPLYTVAQTDAAIQQRVDQALADRDQAFEDRLGPIEEERRTNQGFVRAQAQINSIREMPGFMDHLEAITDVIATGRQQGTPVSLERAYLQVVVPKLSATKDELTGEVRKAILAEMNQTSEENRNSLNPQRVPAVTVKADADKSIAELLEEEAAKQGVRA